MSEKKEKVAQLCLKCHIMYGSPNFDQMCSLCYKQTLAESKKQAQKLEKLEAKPQEKVIQLVTKKTEVEKLQKGQDRLQTKKLQTKSQLKTGKQENNLNEKQIKKQVKKQVKKCALCSKKVGMLGYNCKHCTNQFCKIHRLPEDHECGVDFISLGRKQLKVDIFAIKKAKIDHI